MDFRQLSFDDAPRMTVAPPGPRSREFLEFQLAHEGAAISYPRSADLKG